MKRILALGISTVLAMPIISTSVIFALDGAAGTAPTATTETEKQLSAEDLKAMQMRVEKRKALLKVRLSNVEKLTVQNKCKASQGLVSSVGQRVKGLETSRTEVYTNMTKRLTELSTKLKNKGFDTTKLDAAIQTLQLKISTFDADLSTYKTAVGDLAAQDCKIDPDGFKASLLDARTALETVTKDSAAIRLQLNDVIKPELKTARDSLAAKDTNEEKKQ